MNSLCDKDASGDWAMDFLDEECRGQRAYTWK